MSSLDINFYYYIIYLPNELHVSKASLYCKASLEVREYPTQIEAKLEYEPLLRYPKNTMKYS